ncbi:MAG: protein sorting system archaetidylserine decarboxylase [Haloarculaceae archaeon]
MSRSPTAGAVAPGAFRLATVPVVLALPLALVVPLAVPIVALLGVGAVLLFHRDPDRNSPTAGVLAPADGRISVVREEADGRLRVGTFMSPFDVHVNRAPVAGEIEAVEHRPGAHRPAFSKDSERNERVHVRYAGLEVGDAGFEVDLIAGAVARRIHPYVAPGEAVGRGERIGHISFGSRVDVVFPEGIDRSALLVETGDAVRAGETVLADRRVA